MQAQKAFLHLICFDAHSFLFSKPVLSPDVLMRKDPLSRFYTTLLAINIEQTLHVSKKAFDRIVLGLMVMFLQACSSKVLTVTVLWKKGKA